jgi:hypothetical protein
MLTFIFTSAGKKYYDNEDDNPKYDDNDDYLLFCLGSKENCTAGWSATLTRTILF